MIHNNMKNVHILNHIKSTKSMSETNIKDKKLMVDAIVRIFKSIPPSAITFSNIKKN